MIFDAIQEWFQELLIDGIISNIKGDHLLCGGSRYQAKAPAGFGESLGGGQQTGQQRDQGDADEGNAAARHELLDALAFGGRVVLAVTFQKVDAAPHAEAAAQGNNEGLKNIDCRVKEIHKQILPESRAWDTHRPLRSVSGAPFKKYKII